MSEDVNVSLTLWQTWFLDIMKECIPIITLPEKKNLSWLTKQLTKATKKRDSYFKRESFSIKPGMFDI